MKVRTQFVYVGAFQQSVSVDITAEDARSLSDIVHRITYLMHAFEQEGTYTQVSLAANRIVLFAQLRAGAATPGFSPALDALLQDCNAIFSRENLWLKASLEVDEMSRIGIPASRVQKTLIS